MNLKNLKIRTKQVLILFARKTGSIMKGDNYMKKLFKEKTNRKDKHRMKDIYWDINQDEDIQSTFADLDTLNQNMLSQNLEIIKLFENQK